MTIPEPWVPIVLSAALAFLAGFVLYMVLPLRRGDGSALPDEGRGRTTERVCTSEVQ